MWEKIDAQVPMRTDIVVETKGGWFFAKSQHASSVAKSEQNAIDGLAMAEYMMSLKGRIER